VAVARPLSIAAMRLSRATAGAVAAAILPVALTAASMARAETITPTRDDEVIEVLPATSATRSDDRQLRKRLAERPSDPRLATMVAERYLARARQSGDPRYAGLALAALRAWPDAATAPDEMLFLRATLEQYLHEFDAAVGHLRVLLARPGSARRAQAWLTLATILRVQGRYAESDVACREVGGGGNDVYAAGCLAENAALRGETAAARRSFQALLAGPRLPAGARRWLSTSLAELEERDGRTSAADAGYREVLRLGPDSYAAIAYADFLIGQRRPVEALAVLEGEPRSDTVLLRLAIAGTRAKAASRDRDVAEMRERIALANERPEARVFHGREQAMFALAIDGDAERALELARGDVARQREPLDLLVFTAAARASGRREAIDEARRLKASLGLHDRRIDALL
jgi:tetratricopeptide (TPR) repeat protein